MPVGPDFVCIGAQRAGTTWLHRSLEQVDGVWVPPLKELHYWGHGDRPDRRIRYREHLRMSLPPPVGRRRTRRPEIRGVDRRFQRRYFVGRSSDAWYGQLFAPGREAGCVTGELTPGYAAIPEATIVRLHDLSPSARILYLLRDPIDRTWSQECRALDSRDLVVAELPAERLITKVTSESRAKHSDYVSNLRRWRSVFGDQVSVLWYDDLADDPAPFLSTCLQLIGAPSSAPPPPDDRRYRGSGSAPAPLPWPVEQALARQYLPMLDALAGLFPDVPAVARWHARAAAAAAD